MLKAIYGCGPVCSCHDDLNQHMWGESLLPFMEGSTIYEKICHNAPIYSPFQACGKFKCVSYTAANAGGCTAVCPPGACRPMAQVVAAYVCPSTPRVANPFLEHTAQNCVLKLVGLKQFIQSPVYAGASDYVAINKYCGGLRKYYEFASTGAGNCDQKDDHGIMNNDNFPVSIDMVTDGTSTTIFCGELGGRPDLWQRGVKKVVPTNLAHLSGVPVVWNSGGCWGCIENGFNELLGSTFDGTKVAPTTGVPVCFINCTNEGFGGLYSFHPGTCGIAMADGSVHMVSENLSVIVFCRLVSFKGLEAVTDQF